MEFSSQTTTRHQPQLEYIRYRGMHLLNEYDQKFVIDILWRMRKLRPLTDRQCDYLDLVIDRFRAGQEQARSLSNTAEYDYRGK
jgi:hypothetical protein